MSWQTASDDKVRLPVGRSRDRRDKGPTLKCLCAGRAIDRPLRPKCGQASEARTRQTTASVHESTTDKRAIDIGYLAQEKEKRSDGHKPCASGGFV